MKEEEKKERGRKKRRRTKNISIGRSYKVRTGIWIFGVLKTCIEKYFFKEFISCDGMFFVNGQNATVESGTLIKTLVIIRRMKTRQYI